MGAAAATAHTVEFDFLLQQMAIGAGARRRRRQARILRMHDHVRMLDVRRLGAAALPFDPRRLVQIDFGAHGVRRTNRQIVFGVL